MNKPLAYVLGNQPFCEISLTVNQGVLIPRPETEQLVELVSHYINKNYTNKGSHNKAVTTLIDVGTGSGAIALALAYRHPELHIRGTDISSAALAVATDNKKTISNIANILFLKANLLKPVDDRQFTPADIIVANLPYIPTDRISTLEPNVRDFEPHLALDGGPDGFDLYRQMFDQIANLSWRPQALFCEIDDTQSELFFAETKTRWPRAIVEVRQDLAGFDRFGFVLF